MNNIVLGRYINGNSIIHKMNPAAKLLISFWYVLLAVVSQSWGSNLCLICILLLAIKLSRLKIKSLIKGILPLLWVIVFTMFVQLLFTNGGHVYFQWGIVKITNYGILLSVGIFIRFILIISMSTVFTLTTAPLEIAGGIEYLLSPLKKIKVPVDTLAMMISIALRFIPTLMDEMTTIINAQKARGMDFSSGNPIKRIKKFIPILIPLFVSAFSHAEGLAVAMEARGYQSGMKRTHFHIYKLRRFDWFSLIFMLILGLILIIYRK